PYPDAQGPYRSGTSRQGTPARVRHRIPSISPAPPTCAAGPASSPGQQRLQHRPLRVRQIGAATDRYGRHEVFGSMVFLVVDSSTGDLTTFRATTRHVIRGCHEEWDNPG